MLPMPTNIYNSIVITKSFIWKVSIVEIVQNNILLSDISYGRFSYILCNKFVLPSLQVSTIKYQKFSF